MKTLLSGQKKQFEDVGSSEVRFVQECKLCAIDSPTTEPSLLKALGETGLHWESNHCWGFPVKDKPVCHYGDCGDFNAAASERLPRCHAGNSNYSPLKIRQGSGSSPLQFLWVAKTLFTLPSYHTNIRLQSGRDFIWAFSRKSSTFMMPACDQDLDWLLCAAVKEPRLPLPTAANEKSGPVSNLDELPSVEW